VPGQLKRYQKTGDLHFLTFSCYHRLPYLESDSAKRVFEQSLEAIRTKYSFLVIGYVVMPEHVHLLVTEPFAEPLATALQALKIRCRRACLRVRSGRGDITTSMCSLKKSGSRSCGTFIGTRFTGDWLHGRRIGRGPASIITPPEPWGRWR
jgi:REP element-mobilizing transposase RayT